MVMRFRESSYAVSGIEPLSHVKTSEGEEGLSSLSFQPHCNCLCNSWSPCWFIHFMVLGPCPTVCDPEGVTPSFTQESHLLDLEDLMGC